MRMQLARWGDGLALRLPADVVEAAGLNEGATVEVDVVGNALRIMTLPHRLTLDELIAGMSPENAPAESFDDHPRGEELL